MSQFKRDNIEMLHDILDTFNDPDARRIFNKLTSGDILDLTAAVQAAIKDAVEAAIKDEWAIKDE